jgi:hypothetical protein
MTAQMNKLLLGGDQLFSQQLPVMVLMKNQHNKHRTNLLKRQ